MSKLAYLTIDDAPSKFMKNKVDFLKKKNIPALFFCIGKLIEKNPEPVIYAIKNGFIIGNHAYSHTNFAKMNIKECLDEILKTDKIIDNLYKKIKIKRQTKYFRYPFGAKGDIFFGSPFIFFRKLNKKFNTVENYLQKLNYQPLQIKNFKKRYPERFTMNDADTGWTKDVGEWKIVKYNSKFSLIQHIINKNFSYKNGNEILLIHDMEQTHAYFEKIINMLISKKFKFLNIQ